MGSVRSWHFVVWAAIATIAAVLIAIGIANFKVRAEKLPIYTEVRQKADRNLADKIHQIQEEGNSTIESSILSDLLAEHYNEILSGIKMQYEETKVDILYLIHMITTTGVTKVRVAGVVPYVVFFSISILFVSFIYTVLGLLYERFIMKLFGSILRPQGGPSYDPSTALATQLKTLKDEDPTYHGAHGLTREREKSRLLMASAMAKTQGMGHSVTPEEDVTPAGIFLVIMMVLLIACSALVAWYLDTNYFDAFTKFCKHIAMIEPYDVPTTWSGYGILLLGILSQIVFLVTTYRCANVFTIFSYSVFQSDKEKARPIICDATLRCEPKN